MDIGQGAGVAGASGVRPFLPPLLAGALARGDIGVDFDHSKYHFLESTWFLLVVFALAAIAYALERRRPPTGEQTGAGAAADPTRPGRISANTPERMLLAAAIVIGALEFAGVLAGDGKQSWWGIIAGAACAALGYLAVASLFARARRRVSGSAAALINLYADGLALGIAGISIAAPPLAFLALAAFLLVISRTRAQAGKKYGGLRILR